MKKTIKTSFEDIMQPIMTELAGRTNLNADERDKLVREYLTAQKAYIESAYKQYGTAGFKEAVSNIRNFYRSGSLAQSNKFYSGRYGDNVLQYMTDFYYRGE